VVHANSLKADIIAGLAARLARVPVIWHVRDKTRGCGQRREVPEIVVDGETGLPIPMGEAFAMADAYARLSPSRHAPGEWGEWGRVFHFFYG
jgi:hypothetical protein